MINVEVERNSNETNLSVLRRFTKRTQGAGILSRVRSIRYRERILSHYKNKKKTLEQIRRRAEREELIKLGKLQPVENRRGGMKK